MIIAAFVLVSFLTFLLTITLFTILLFVANLGPKDKK
jgi:hypothetical protein